MIVGILGNTRKQVIEVVVKSLIEQLGKRDIPFVFHEKLGNWVVQNIPAFDPDRSQIYADLDFPQHCTMVIALGGDGTMLEAARVIGRAGIPVLGVNLGKLGFLAEVAVEEIGPCLDEILQGQTFIEDRMVLEAKSAGDKNAYYGLNDIVIDKGESPRVIDIETHVDGEYVVTYTADGLIITTPTGSTGYSLASGGPIVVPQSDVIVINPISPHSLSARPIAVPSGSTIRVVARSEGKEIHITADGQTQGFYDPPIEFTVRKAPYTVKLIKRKHRTYFELLRTKLFWGRDVRVKL